MKKALPLIASGIAALALAAPALALSPSQYRAKMSATCVAGIAKLNALPHPKNASGLYPYFVKATKLSEALAQKLLTIPVPASLKAPIVNAFSKQGRFQGALEQLTKELKTSKDPKKLVNQATPTLDSLNKAANTAWRAAGLPKCGG